ncbi:PDZ domain-containing protein [Dyella sp. C11]|uniref:PDZ domain-containing protein n=1 Tax=Dyella sp. C11 TaxID=2126991 RepID=UPI0013005262|nr:PDZ domain-containing protein [Dyella sp. C11]
MLISRKWIFALATCICAANVCAEDWNDYKHTSDSSLVWRRSDHKALTLNSEGNKGIEVMSVSPDGLWGLHKGDRITSLNNTPVYLVSDLLEKLPRTDEDTATLGVVNNGNARTVSVTSEAYKALK